MSAAAGPLADPSMGKKSGGAGRGKQTPEARLAQTVRLHAPLRVWLASKELIQRDAVVQWRWQGGTLGGELRERGRAPLSAWIELTGEMPHPGCVCDEGAGGGWCAHSVAVARVAAIQAAAEAAGLSTGRRAGSGEGAAGGGGRAPGASSDGARRPGPAALRFLLFRRGRDLVVEIQEARGAAVRDLGRLLEASRLAAAGIAEGSDLYRRGGSHGASPFRPPDLAVLQLLGRFGRRGSGSARITIDLDRASELLGRLIEADDAFGPLGGPLRRTPSPPFLQLEVAPGRPGRSLCKAIWRVPGLDMKADEPVRVLAYRGGSDGEGHLLAGDLVGAVAGETVRLASGLPPNGREMPDDELARQLEGLRGNPLPPGVQVMTAAAGSHRVGPPKTPEPVLAVGRRGDRTRLALAFEYGDARARPAPEAIEFSARRRAPGGERIAGEQARAELLRRNPTRFAPVRRGDHTQWMPRNAEAELTHLLTVVEGGLVPEVGGTFISEESTLIELATAGEDRWRGCRIEGGDLLADFAVAGEPIELGLTIGGATRDPVGTGESTALGAAGWFEIELNAASGEERIDPLLLLRLMGEGKEYVPLARGGRARIPTEELLRLNELLETTGAEATGGGARFRARNTSLGLVGYGDGSGPRVHFEDQELRRVAGALSGSGTGFRGRTEEHGGREGKLPDAPIPKGLEATLRDYQLTGYRWLCFLAAHRLGGVLADDMGLGKTVQTLALLLNLRESRGPGPNLVVAPSSVVMGWAAEAARFAPELKVLSLTGPRRWRDDPDPAEFDLVLTSYALLRRDALRLASTSWRIVVFDEAQFLKNLATRSASAARLLRAEARFALSGTPVENRLAELF
ncbi:MAG: hypothetical protein CL908_05800, partial [Deltaproteobacteria bacterium]|nr:hypothetical protein [Deltaproteobacteria bacterium]